MKGSLVIRLVQDTEAKKSYIAIEGDIVKASEAEKESIKEKLSHAIGYILGMEEALTENTELTTTPESVKADFEPTNEEVPACLSAPQSDDTSANKAPQTQSASSRTNTPTSDPQAAKDVVIGFGQYAKLTPREVVEKHGKRGTEYLEWLLATAEKGELRKATPELIVCVKACLEGKTEEAPKEESKKTDGGQQSAPDNFETLMDELRAFAHQFDPEYLAIESYCNRWYGTSFDEMVEKQDKRLESVLKELKTLEGVA